MNLPSAGRGCQGADKENFNRVSIVLTMENAVCKQYIGRQKASVQFMVSLVKFDCLRSFAAGSDAYKLRAAKLLAVICSQSRSMPDLTSTLTLLQISVELRL